MPVPLEGFAVRRVQVGRVFPLDCCVVVGVGVGVGVEVEVCELDMFAS